MRQKLVVGNWKMHGSRAQVTELLAGIVRGSGSVSGKMEIGVCPTNLHIALAADSIAGSELKLGAQNVHFEEQGAFTGEVAAAMLAEFGVSYVLVGHSERREIFAESDQFVARKFVAVQAQAMTPILCVGETLEQRQANATAEVVLSQLDAVIEIAGIDCFAQAVIAYEPIWAIGTGQTASPAQAQEVHRLIREHLGKHNKELAEGIRLLYGGSVKSSNAADLFSQADIDGGLIGGASLEAEEFISICKSAD